MDEQPGRRAACMQLYQFRPRREPPSSRPRCRPLHGRRYTDKSTPGQSNGKTRRDQVSPRQDFATIFLQSRAIGRPTSRQPSVRCHVRLPSCRTTLHAPLATRTARLRVAQPSCKPLPLHLPLQPALLAERKAQFASAAKSRLAPTRAHRPRRFAASRPTSSAASTFAPSSARSRTAQLQAAAPLVPSSGASTPGREEGAFASPPRLLPKRPPLDADPCPHASTCAV